MNLASIILRSRQALTWLVVILLLASFSFGSSVFADDDNQGKATVRVMTQNLFMGTDFPELVTAKTPEEFNQAVTTAGLTSLTRVSSVTSKLIARPLACGHPITRALRRHCNLVKSEECR
jgi:hypothetical protein